MSVWIHSLTSDTDWIQDSLRERHLKPRGPRPNSLSDKLSRLDGAPGYVWRALSRTLEHGEVYVIITLVGESRNSFASFLLPCSHLTQVLELD